MAPYSLVVKQRFKTVTRGSIPRMALRVVTVDDCKKILKKGHSFSSVFCFSVTLRCVIFPNAIQIAPTIRGQRGNIEQLEAHRAHDREVGGSSPPVAIRQE